MSVHEDAEMQKFHEKSLGRFVFCADAICVIVLLHWMNGSARPFQVLPLASGASEWAITLSILERNHIHAAHTNTDPFD